MRNRNVWDKYCEALDKMGAEQFCEALAKAIGEDMLNKSLDYIDRCYELNLGEEDETEEEE